MHEVLVNRLGGLNLPRKSVVRLTDCPDITLGVYRGRKTTMQQQQQQNPSICLFSFFLSHFRIKGWVDCGLTAFLTVSVFLFWF